MKTKRIKGIICILLTLIIMVPLSGNVFADGNKITPSLTTSMSKYIPYDTVPLTLKLTGTQAGDKTNSVTFEIEYDSSAFQFLDGDVNSSVVNGYIPFQTKLNLGQGTVKTVAITYLNTDNDVSLQEGDKVFTIYFKVKKDAVPGVKTFRLKPVNMLDTGEKVYNINDGNPVEKTVEITNAVVIEGYINLYLGEDGTGLNTSVMSSLKQQVVNETLNSLKFTLKHNTSDAGVVFSGSEVFVPNENGNLAIVDANNKVTARFRIFTQDQSNTLLIVNGAGYLSNNMNIDLTAGRMYSVNSATTPAELYPGDIGQISAGQLVMTPDGKINNIDFSGWLKLYKSSNAGTAAGLDKLTADLTKDGVIDNVDFSLWLATYKKLAA